MLVLEFMEGGDLWSALRGPHRDELQWYGRGRALALDIARGLHFLHEHKAGSLLHIQPYIQHSGICPPDKAQYPFMDISSYIGINLML